MQLPARIGKYELLQFLGGGMSHVYRSRDTVIGREVAVKILTETGMQDPEARIRFLQEAKLAGTIKHDHIVTVHDYGEEDGRPFIVLEFLEGEDLRDAIQKKHTGDLKYKLRIALEIAQALAFVHEKNIVHRDIKPENIFIERTGRAKLMDFGIAKAQGLSLTKTGNSLGTPYYMAPEQVMGTAITELVDIYSFGILFYELLCGQKPVTGDTVERLFYVILHETPPEQPLIDAGVPENIRGLIKRATAKKPEERYKNFGEMIALLNSFLADEPAPALPAPAAAPQLKKKPLLMVAVATVVIAIAFWFLFLRPKPAISPSLLETLQTPTGEMALVPEGQFQFGKDRTPVTLPAFYVDRTEVSNEAYGKFCAATNHALPPGFANAKPDEPVVNITIDDAMAFAGWAGKRLPTEQEWEKAARGEDGRNYPWGDQTDASRANVADNLTVSPKGLKPVTSFETGVSPHRALNMTGNVWEFVNERKQPSIQAVESFSSLLIPPPTVSEPWYIMKGGAFSEKLAMGVLNDSGSVPGRFVAPSIGFRCVKSIEVNK